VFAIKKYPPLHDQFWIEGEQRTPEWAYRYYKLVNKHTLVGVRVSDYFRIRAVIFRWFYDPSFQCVQNLIKRDYQIYLEE
jgi:hypothetical protein